MYFKYRLIIMGVGLIICNVFAVATTLNSIQPNPNTKESSTTLLQSGLPNLNGIDIDTSDINQLQRKLQIEKAQAELKKIKTSGNTVGNGKIQFPNENAQTTVTGVAINQEGKKIAWLQFTDGGSLTVNIGSKVGKYTVTDISMTGVTLSETSGRKKTKNVYLKRAYATADIGKKLPLNSNSNMFFTPSPVLTGANASNNENVVVPPIIQTK